MGGGGIHDTYNKRIHDTYNKPIIHIAFGNIVCLSACVAWKRNYGNLPTRPMVGGIGQGGGVASSAN